MRYINLRFTYLLTYLPEFKVTRPLTAKSVGGQRDFIAADVARNHSASAFCDWLNDFKAGPN